MGICKDQSITFLADKGYNVVRLPGADLKPLMLLGRQNGETLTLGPLDALITNPPGPLPDIGADTSAADLNGKTSSRLSLGIGISILGNIIGAMGGTLGAKLNYSNAKSVEFTYSGVKLNSVQPLIIGNYLKSADVDAQNLVLKEYVLGNGDLYVVTRTAKSSSFSVTFSSASGAGVAIDVPAIRETIGGNIEVDSDSTKSATVKFSGPVDLVFAFQCFQVGVVEGILSLTNVKAGTIAGAVPLEEGEAMPAQIQERPQLLTIRR